MHPAAVVVKAPKIYLVAKYQQDDIYRNLLVHRISEASVDFLENAVPADFSLEQYLDLGGLDVPVNGDETYYDIEIDIKATPETANLLDDLQESPIHHTQILKQRSKQRYRLTIHSQRTYQLIEWIVARGRYVTVTRPSALKEDIRNHLSQALANY